MKPIAPAIVLLAAASAASAQTPAGGDFQVNAYTTGFQRFARPSMEPDGDFVVAWADYDQDGSGAGIFARRFAATGVPHGGEFQVHTYTTGRQGVPTIAVGRRGDFVAVWRSPQDGSGSNIFGQRYDPSGNRIGSEFQVNTFTPGYQISPRVAWAFDNSFVVVWTSRYVDGGNEDGVAGRRYDPWGNAIGGEFVVNTHTTGWQQFPDVAVNASGSFVVVWEDTNVRDGDGRAVFGQRFSPLGTRVGSEFQVNTYTTGNQEYVSISGSPAGGYVVVWNSPDGSGVGVSARRFDASGSPIGSDFVVNTYTTGYQLDINGKQVAHDARGNFVITWMGPGYGSYGGIFAQRFSASGARRGGEFVVSSYTLVFQELPSIASDAVGNFVVTWDGYSPIEPSVGILARRFGGLLPAALRVNTSGNGILEPGEVGDVMPTWRNANGATQTFTATLGSAGGPTGGIPQILDSVGVYGTVANGASAECTTCYNVLVPSPSSRPVTHWDGTVVESIVPDTQGQQKQWLLHVGRSFTDVPDASPFYRFIETMVHNNVTGGCNTNIYCPTDPATREQMALFVLVAKEGLPYSPPTCTIPMFADVQPFSGFCRWIEELARRGVVAGCGGGNYCPFNAVTREQMAVFVLRALEPTLNPPACTTPMYGDVPASSPFCRWIEELTRRGVVTGCGGGNYCPTDAVTREQMAVFISVTFGLTLYGP